MRLREAVRAGFEEDQRLINSSEQVCSAVAATTGVTARPSAPIKSHGFAETAVRRLLIVGQRGGTHVGGSLERSAHSLALNTQFLEISRASKGPRFLNRVRWRFLDHKPLGWNSFGQTVVEMCERWRPDVLLVTGLSPVNANALARIKDLGVCRCNYLTDDPWNPAHRSRWFLNALAQYDFVFTPRRANVDDLHKTTNACVHYLPFAYDPDLFAPVELAPAEQVAFDSDVVFAGGADRERIPYLAALRQAGFNVALYGGYWERFPETRSMARGLVGVEQLRKAIRGAKIALCLVRRANRDGHAMRSFEVPAVKACMLVEKTEEHVSLFGQDGEAVSYFSNIPEMLEKTAWLLSRPEERSRLTKAAHRVVVEGGHTYRDRLKTILQAVVSS
jgi:spore maturation protein CgeB